MKGFQVFKSCCILFLLGITLPGTIATLQENGEESECDAIRYHLTEVDNAIDRICGDSGYPDCSHVEWESLPLFSAVQMYINMSVTEDQIYPIPESVPDTACEVLVYVFIKVTYGLQIYNTSLPILSLGWSYHTSSFSSQCGLYSHYKCKPQHRFYQCISMLLQVGWSTGSFTFVDFFTREGEREYNKYMTTQGFGQNAHTFTTENMWFPLTSERLVHVLNSQALGGNTDARLYIVGYRWGDFFADWALTSWTLLEKNFSL